MRITEEQLRRIIREELDRSIDEMAWGGHIGLAGDPVDPAYEDDPDIVNSTFAGPREIGKNRHGAIRYTMGPAWAKQAQKHYSYLPFTIWTAPYIGAGYSTMSKDFRPDLSPGDIYDELDNRMRIMTLAVGLPQLEALGYDVTRVGLNDFVVLFTTTVTEKEYLGSPWMLFHAFSDGGTPAISQLVPGWREIWQRFSIGMEPWMTMKSARTKFFTKNNQSARDVAAEAMCQELLTRDGFTLQNDKKGKPPPKSLQALVPVIKAAAEQFRQNAPGHLVTVVLT